jgi:hypothetical protein
MHRGVPLRPGPEEIVMAPCHCLSALLIPGPPPDPGCRPQVRAAIEPPPRPDRDREAGLGVVDFLTHKRERAEAILDSEGRWQCPRLPVLDRVLNTLHAPRRGEGPFGQAELARVAAGLRGEGRADRRRV